MTAYYVFLSKNFTVQDSIYK